MNQSSTWKWVLAIIVIILVIWGLSSWGKKASLVTDAISLEETSDVTVSEPAADDVIESPLSIKGEAVGPWFFEANFPIKLVNEVGDVLADYFATAEGEWTTEELVPFTGTVEFDAAGAETGYLLFGKDNPSGLPENELWVKLPVRFAVEEEVALDDSNETDDSADGEVADDGEVVDTEDNATAIIPTPVIST